MNIVNISKYLPIINWAKTYTYPQAIGDCTAAVIVTLMLIPQALAYAMLAGLPAYIGLYASMIPLIAYGIFGTSSVLAVGPVAIAALMTATAIAPYSAIDPSLGMMAAVIMAIISGVMLLTAGILRLGFLANFLSHPVITGFISAASLLIAISQLAILLGFSVSGDNVVILTGSIWKNIHLTQINTLLLSTLTITILILSRKYATRLFNSLGFSNFISLVLTRSIPAILVAISTVLMSLDISWLSGIKTIGEINAGLPVISVPKINLEIVFSLLLPATLITIVSYVESISVAQSLAVKKREHIDPDQELIALGIANIAAGISSSLPVAGGVSRSAVNADAGAMTPAASVLTGIGIMLSTILLSEWLGVLPRFILAATIVVAVLSLFDIKAFHQAWLLNKQDFFALFITFILTLFISVEVGISTGVILSIAMHVIRSSRPHIAIVGKVSGTEHFRNVDRQNVIVHPHFITLRIDESLYFANINFLQKKILEIVKNNKNLKHLVLMCPAVNNIDISAIHVLETVNDQLRETGVKLHLSEVKGPVMDTLKRSNLLEKLSGEVFLSQFMAYTKLSGQ